MIDNMPEQDETEILLDRLRTVHVDGPGRGGPFVGIVHNDLTRAILAAGKRIIPQLISRLPGSNFDEAVYLVFLLRELRASEAQNEVRKLKSELEKRSVGRDLTLKMQVEYFLRDVDTW